MQTCRKIIGLFTSRFVRSDSLKRLVLGTEAFGTSPFAVSLGFGAIREGNLPGRCSVVAGHWGVLQKVKLHVIFQLLSRARVQGLSQVLHLLHERVHVTVLHGCEVQREALGRLCPLPLGLAALSPATAALSALGALRDKLKDHHHHQHQEHYRSPASHLHTQHCWNVCLFVYPVATPRASCWVRAWVTAGTV